MKCIGEQLKGENDKYSIRKRGTTLTKYVYENELFGIEKTSKSKFNVIIKELGFKIHRLPFETFEEAKLYANRSNKELYSWKNNGR